MVTTEKLLELTKTLVDTNNIDTLFNVYLEHSGNPEFMRYLNEREIIYPLTLRAFEELARLEPNKAQEMIDELRKDIRPDYTSEQD